ncbi:uncharacterized protein [Fopius arisanus]|uniref:Uncharacterized protein n=1 Tax=Fopius arisanus TaxID=64838 RepID=A0A9R1U751_9HYME|nr:PREDICTED: uncharacterized protein LOC105271534 [Fopius arisanus]
MNRDVERLRRIISQIADEIVLVKTTIDRRESELLVVEKSISQVKMLQEKALHVSKCNEMKFREREEQVEVMKGIYERLAVTRGEVQGNITDQLLRKIAELKILRDSLQKEFHDEKSGTIDTRK